jgi:hypothetical protein
MVQNIGIKQKMMIFDDLIKTKSKVKTTTKSKTKNQNKQQNKTKIKQTTILTVHRPFKFWTILVIFIVIDGIFHQDGPKFEWSVTG